MFKILEKNHDMHIGYEITLVVTVAEDLHQLSDDNNYDKNDNIMPTISRLVGQCARTVSAMKLGLLHEPITSAIIFLLEPLLLTQFNINPSMDE